MYKYYGSTLNKNKGKLIKGENKRDIYDDRYYCSYICTRTSCKLIFFKSGHEFVVIYLAVFGFRYV